MAIRLPRTITVLVDSREQNPLLFPATTVFRYGNVGTHPMRDSTFSIRVVTQVTTLQAGDYTIKGHEALVGIERKGSIDELGQNLSTKDRARFSSAFKRFLLAYEYPLLLLDFVPESVWTGYSDINGLHTLDRLMGTIIPLDVPFMWGTNKPPKGSRRTPTKQQQSRRRLGELVLHWMLTRIVLAQRQKETTCVTPKSPASRARRTVSISPDLCEGYQTSIVLPSIKPPPTSDPSATGFGTRPRKTSRTAATRGPSRRRTST